MNQYQGNQLFYKMYETPSGVINKSLYQLSGKYKILVSSRRNGYDLYLCDYTGYKMPIDITKRFMPQLSRFLKTRTNIDNSKTNYAGYRNGDKLYYHIPYYVSDIDNKIPEYAVILKVMNKDYDSFTVNNLYKESKTIDVINLENIHVKNIIDEIISIFNQSPVSLFWSGENSDHTIILNGFDYVNGVVTTKSINIHDFVLCNNSTEDDITFLNDLIMRKFEENNMIYSRFLNLEFEFDYDKENKSDVDFQNFYAFLSDAHDIEFPEFDNLPEKSKIIKTYSFDKRKTIDFVDIDMFQSNTTTINKREEIIDTIFVNEIAPQEHLYKVMCLRFSVGDIIKIYSNDEEIINYRISETDIKDKELQTAISIFKKIQYLSNDYVNVDVVLDNGKPVVYFRSPSQLKYEFYTGNYESINFKIIDRDKNSPIYKLSMNITKKDVLTTFNTDAEKLIIDSVKYDVVTKFRYDGRKILRLDKNIYISKNTSAQIVKEVYDKFQEFVPVNLLNRYNNIDMLPLYDFDMYKAEIYPVIQSYNQHSDTPKQNNMGLYDAPNNSRIIFANGSTSFMNVHVLNYDERCGMKNGCVNEYGYFLINGECPSYMLSDFRSYRYFRDTPNHKSVIRKVNNSRCETIFLGIKYSFDIRYEGYKFSVSIDPYRTESDLEDYYVIVDDLNKDLSLVINKTFSFVNITNIDLSLFYNINRTFNLSDRHTEDFSNIGFRFGHKIRKSDFDMLGLSERRFFDRNNGFLVCRDEYSTDLFTDILYEGEDFTVYYYDKDYVEERNEYVQLVTYSITFNKIHDLMPNSFYAEDILVTIHMGEIDELSGEQLSIFSAIDESSVLHDLTDKPFTFSETIQKELHEKYEHHVKVDDSWDEMKLIRYFHLLKNDTEMFHDFMETVSLRSQFFEIRYKNGSGNLKIPFMNDFMNFNENFDGSLEWIEDKINRHKISGTYDNEFKQQLLNSDDFYLDLFDTNKFWDIISTYSINMKTSRVSEESLIKYVKKFHISTTKNYLNNNIVQIKDSDRRIKISIVDIDHNKSGSGVMYRHSSQYRPYMTLFDGIINAQQINDYYDDVNIIYTLFSKNFGKFNKGTEIISKQTNINGTGLWREINDIVSTLFVGDDIEINSYISRGVIDLKESLKLSIIKDQYIINDDNREYISRFTGNIDEYERDIYIKYIIENFYDVECVIVDNYKIEFNYDKNNFMIYTDFVDSECKVRLIRK